MISVTSELIDILRNIQLVTSAKIPASEFYRVVWLESERVNRICSALYLPQVPANQGYRRDCANDPTACRSQKDIPLEVQQVGIVLIPIDYYARQRAAMVIAVLLSIILRSGTYFKKAACQGSSSLMMFQSASYSRTPSTSSLAMAAKCRAVPSAAPVAGLVGDIHFNVVHAFRKIIGTAARKFQQIRIHRNLHEQMRLAVICGDKLLHGVIGRLARLVMDYRNGYRMTVESQGNFIRIIAVLHFKKNEMLLRSPSAVSSKRDFAGNMDYFSSHDGVAAVMIPRQSRQARELPGNRVNLHMQLVRAFGNACAPIRARSCLLVVWRRGSGHMNPG